jgi:outer membrane protein
MTETSRRPVVIGMMLATQIVGLATSRAWAQPQAALISPTAAQLAAGYRLTIDEARQRALASNKLLQLAALNVQSKGHATSAARTDYFPKIIGNVVYMRFSDPLGTVITTRSRPRLGIAPQTIPANVLNQNTSFTNIVAVQPITDLLKVREGVKIAEADTKIAQAQLDKGIREVLDGVNQLYWGLLAAQQIHAGVLDGYRGAEEFARTGTLEARTALVETKQALQQVEAQVADLQEQLAGLLDLPAHTAFELIEPPLPGLPVACVDDAIRLTLAASPDLREAAQNIAKAEAATRAGRLDYVPSIAVTGGYTNQTAASYIQPNFGYVGVVGSYTFIDWGKRHHVIREREHLIGMATLKLRQTQEELCQKATKAYRALAESQAALTLTRELVGLRKEAETKALAAAKMNPTGLLAATKARATAEVDYVKADLAYRQAHLELTRLIGG